MKKFIFALVLVGYHLSANADTGHEWQVKSESARLATMSTVISNMKGKGCTIRLGAKYCVRQINAFFARRENRSMQVHEAFGLIATDAGENFNCPG